MSDRAIKKSKWPRKAHVTSESLSKITYRYLNQMAVDRNGEQKSYLHSLLEALISKAIEGNIGALNCIREIKDTELVEQLIIVKGGLPTQEEE